MNIGDQLIHYSKLNRDESISIFESKRKSSFDSIK
jgi:hypothetical protein